MSSIEILAINDTSNTKNCDNATRDNSIVEILSDSEIDIGVIKSVISCPSSPIGFNQNTKKNNNPGEIVSTINRSFELSENFQVNTSLNFVQQSENDTVEHIKSAFKGQTILDEIVRDIGNSTVSGDNSCFITPHRKLICSYSTRKDVTTLSQPGLSFRSSPIISSEIENQSHMLTNKNSFWACENSINPNIKERKNCIIDNMGTKNGMAPVSRKRGTIIEEYERSSKRKLITRTTHHNITHEVLETTNDDSISLNLLANSEESSQILKSMVPKLHNREDKSPINNTSCFSDGEFKEKRHLFEPIESDSSIHHTQGSKFNQKMNEQNGGVQVHKSKREHVVNGKYFTKEEFNSMLQVCINDSRFKKKYNDVNKITKDKDKLAQEMVLDINETIINYFDQIGIDLDKELFPTSIIKNSDNIPIIKFKRKCNSIYDYNHDIFFPCDEILAEESLCILFYQAIDFFYLYRSQKRSLWRELKRLKQSGKKVIIILDGYLTLEKDLTNLENKKYREKVHLNINGITKSSYCRKHTEKDERLEALGMKTKDLDRRVNEILIYTEADIFPVNNSSEFFDWLNNLIWVLGKRRYDLMAKNKEWAHIDVKIGKTRTEVLSKCLQQLKSVTQIKAERVTHIYNSFQKMFEDFQKGYLLSGKDGNPLMTKTIEKAMHALLTSDDPDEKIYTD